MDETPPPGGIERAIDNASATLRGLLPGAGPRGLHTGRSDVLMPVIAALLTGVLLHVATGAFLPYAILDEAGLLALSLLVVAVAAPRGTMRACLITVTWAWTIGRLIALPVAVASYELAGLAAFLAPGLAILALLSRAGAVRGAVAALFLAALPFLLTLAPPPPPDPLPPVDGETVWPAQTRLLAEQTERLRPGVPDTPELFALLGAGYPSERVFRREVEAVTEILSDRYDARGRILRLVNDQRDPLRYPALTKTTLLPALTSLAGAMNPEDVALIFLTSHGAPNALATAMPGLTTSDLTPRDLAQALDQAGIGAAVVIVSACYSGTFTDALAAPDRLILTAASAERTSFGCADENEWTYWGRAFFTEALPQATDLREAATRAAQIVAEWEVDGDHLPSQPQIREGADIGRYLDALEAR